MNQQTNIRSTADYQAMDAAHHWHPFSDMADLNRKGSRVIASAQGVWLTDTDGNRFIDGMSGLWCVNVGYGREEIVEAVARHDPAGVAGVLRWTIPEAAIADRLGELAVPTLSEGESATALLETDGDLGLEIAEESERLAPRGYGHVRLNQLALRHLLGAA